MTHRPILSAPVGQEVKHTTCYMCACRCGIRVHLDGGKVRYIQGNPDHPVNKGVLCAKGSAGIMQHYAPSRLRAPLKRVGPRGSGQFQEISWDEAMATATAWLAEIRRTDPRKLAFYTGRDQSQALTGWWAMQYGTPNYAAHGGFCSVNMAAAGLYTLGGSFWEFGEPDWEHTRYLMLWGVAEDHASNPIKIGLGKLKGRGAKIVAINPVRSGYGAIADEWIGIRPGTDGLLAGALIHELLRAGRVDVDFLLAHTNAAHLVIQAPGKAEDGMILRDPDGRPLVWDREERCPRAAADPAVRPALKGEVTALGRRCVPAFELLARRFLAPEYEPDSVSDRCGLSTATIRRLAAELAHAAFDQAIELPIPWTDMAGRSHPSMIGRPVAMHAMRGISAHSNGFHTCRTIHLLQALLGAIDTPGSFRYKPPYPRPPGFGPTPGHPPVYPGQPLESPPLGFPHSPEDLLVGPEGEPLRLDKAYSWEHPLANHGMIHTAILNAVKGEPYPIDTLFLYMANMAWNSAMNTAGTMEMLAATDPATGEYRIPRIIYSDAYHSETVAYADLVLPDTTYLERYDCVSLLDRPISDADGAADAIRHPVVAPDRDVRPFQDVLLDLGARLGLPGMSTEDGSPRYPGGYADYIVNHERAPGVGPLAGFRGPDGTIEGKGPPNPDQLERYIENGGFWRQELPADGRYYKMANRAYLEHAYRMGFIPRLEPVTIQLYAEVLQRFRAAARGHGPVVPPEHLRPRVERFFDPLPFWYPPFEETAIDRRSFPLHAVTQRPMHMYHSWGGQNAWLRQITAANRLFVHRRTAAALGIAEDGWVWIESHHGRVKCQVRLVDGVNPDTVWTWNAIGKRKGTWGLKADAAETERGFLLNHLISELLPRGGPDAALANADPVTGQAAWFDLRVRLVPCSAEEAALAEPRFEPVTAPPGLVQGPDVLSFGAEFRARREARGP